MTPETPRALRILTFEEYRALINAVAEESLTIAAYTALLGETGMRKAEGLRLRWDDVDLRRRKVMLKETKSGRPRYIPLSYNFV